MKSQEMSKMKGSPIIENLRAMHRVQIEKLRRPIPDLAPMRASSASASRNGMRAGFT
jgi:hypothetical protein